MKVGQFIHALMKAVRAGNIPADAEVIIHVPGIVTTTVHSVVDIVTFHADERWGKVDPSIVSRVLSNRMEGLQEQGSGCIIFTKDKIPKIKCNGAIDLTASHEFRLMTQEKFK